MYQEKLKELGIKLVQPPKPAGSYIPTTRAGNLLFVSGQIPMQMDESDSNYKKVAYTGKVSSNNIEDAKKSAKICAINILSQIQASLGDLDKIQNIVKISGFVNSEPEFYQHPTVINAASDLLVEILGEKARHSRIAVGVSSLPLDSMTEIDAVIQVKN